MGLNSAIASAETPSFFGSNEQDFLPVEQAFPLSTRVEDGALVVQWQVTPGYYLYQDRIKVEAVAPDVQVGQLKFARGGVVKQDPYFGATKVFYETIDVQIPVTLPDSRDEAQLRVTYQGCAEAGLCYPPETEELLYIAPQPSGETTADGAQSEASGWDSLESAAGLVDFLTRAEPLWVALAFLILGLGLTFTPCVLPMVPIVSAIVAGARQTSTAQAFVLSLAYVLGMALTYAIAGVITGLLGASFNVQMYLQSPWVLGVVAGLFVLFALAMFNVFDLQLPAALRERLTQRSARLSGGRLASVFGIGALSALIVSPCVSAPLAGALVYIGTTQDALLGGLALFMLGLGMGIPLLIVGTGGKRLLPQSGPWLDTVKGAFGVLMLAVAVWLLARLLPASITVALWGLLAIFCAVHLGTFEPAAAGWPRSRKAAGVSFFTVGLILLIGSLAGARDPLQPLAPFSPTATILPAGSAAVGTAGATEAFAGEHNGFLRFDAPDRLPELLAAASASGRPVVLDFYADWCISCKVMERQVFAEPGIQARLRDFVLLQVDITDNSEAHRALLDRFALFGPPAILFFAADGTELRELRVLGEMDRDQFSRHLAKVEEEISS